MSGERLVLLLRILGRNQKVPQTGLPEINDKAPGYEVERVREPVGHYHNPDYPGIEPGGRAIRIEVQRRKHLLPHR
jgi:hypothetical protein